MGPGAELANEWLEKLHSMQALSEGRGIAGQQEDRRGETVKFDLCVAVGPRVHPF